MLVSAMVSYDAANPLIFSTTACNSSVTCFRSCFYAALGCGMKDYSPVYIEH